VRCFAAKALGNAGIWNGNAKWTLLVPGSERISHAGTEARGDVQVDDTI
jgi:hypothetical protein